MSRFSQARPIGEGNAVAATGFVLFASICFASMNAIIRHLSTELDPLVIVFFRNLAGLVAMTPWILRYGVGSLRTGRFGLICLRSAIGFVSMAAWFTCITFVPMGNAVALSFCAPLFTAIIAVVFLREVIRMRRIAALLVGFGGVMIILRPGVSSVGFGELLVLLAASSMALSIVCMKVLTRTESPGSLVVYQTLMGAAVALIPALFFWTWPSLEMWFWIIVLGIIASTAHMAFTRGFAMAETTFLMPFDYIRLPVSVWLGWVLFNEITDVWTWVGGAVIAASALYITHREAVAARRKRTKE